MHASSAGSKQDMNSLAQGQRKRSSRLAASRRPEFGLAATHKINGRLIGLDLTDDVSRLDRIPWTWGGEGVWCFKTLETA